MAVFTVGSKLALFLLQFAVMRVIGSRRRRRAAAAGTPLRTASA
jgi:hypothetical protein